MEKRNFYVKPIGNMQSDNSNDSVYSVGESYINLLASMALTLESEPDFTESFGYASALKTYFDSHEHPLKPVYLRLVSSPHGEEILCNAIQLALIEQSFRETGFAEEKLERYNRVIDSYQRQLTDNNEEFAVSKEHDKVK